MTTTLPTRTQLNGAMEFFASYAGSAYEDAGDAELQTDLTLKALRNAIVIDSEGGTGIATVRIPEGMVQGYMEQWLRANWEQMVDYMVDNELALEDPDAIEDNPCEKETAHGPHYWDLGEDPEGKPTVEYHCDGISVHPRCMIAGGRNADA